MLPIIVFPFHDTGGLMSSHLETITPQLKNIFVQAFVSLSPPTAQAQTGRIEKLIIFSRDPDEMKREWENSSQESRKRLKYTIPVLQLLLESVEKQT